MEEDYRFLERMQEFTENDLPSLSECSLGALELFTKEGLPSIKFPEFKNPVIAGSGNARVTAEILYEGQDVVFANESNYEEQAKKDADGAIVFSASGNKHAPLQAKAFMDNGKDTLLVTCNPISEAGELLGESKVILTKKNKEPYTYNTSTYMGWILAKTREDPKKILDFINKEVCPKIPINLKDYDGFLLLTPNRFSKVNGLFTTKFVELFGRKIGRDVKTLDEMKHAIAVVPSKTELCIRFGMTDEIVFEGDILDIPLPENCDLAAMMAIGYYVIGQIQEQHPQYFKGNIRRYVDIAASKDFGKGITVIVE